MLTLLFTLLLVRLVLDDFILLPLHPVDVLDFVLLHLVVVASLPVVLALLVLQAVQLGELLLDGVDLGAD